MIKEPQSANNSFDDIIKYLESANIIVKAHNKQAA